MKLKALIEAWKPRGNSKNRGQFSAKFAAEYGVTLNIREEFVTSFSHGGELSTFGGAIVDFLLKNRIYRSRE